MKQHTMEDNGTGFLSCFRQDLIKSSDPNFRTVDMELAPDGSLYFVDWHNVLVGHMQHNARDPLRDHVHGRVYRITYPERPLVGPPTIHNASIDELLENLKLPEYRARYRTKRELRGRNPKEVKNAISKWVAQLNPEDARYEHHLLEAFWVTWGLNDVDMNLFNKLFVSKDHRVRSALIRCLRYNMDRIPNSIALLDAATKDSHGRVRLEALVTTSWLPKEKALPLLANYQLANLDGWTKPIFEAVQQNFTTRIKPINQPVYTSGGVLQSGKENLSPFLQKGKEIYYSDASCATCHQADGKGLLQSGFPPLAASEWVVGDIERLIKITLKGVVGPMSVSGKRYEGSVPMMAYEKILSDEEIAAVLSFVRNSFGNRADQISAETVKKIRDKYKDQKGYFTTSEL
jgi:mono/diheme cytochrome c family protein